MNKYIVVKSKPGFRKTIIVFAAILLMAYSAASTSVGTAPGTQNIGELDAGNSYEIHFYVTTRGIDSSFTIEPEFQRASASNYEREPDENGFNPHEASQEDISDWIEFGQDTYSVNPNNERVTSLDGGGSVNYNEEVSYIINIPEDAEPGYHRGAVDLNPDLSGGGAGASSVSNIGLTQYNFYFKVPGHAERDLRTMDVRSVRTGDDSARFDFIVENNGTVTTWVQRSGTTVYNDLGEAAGEVSTGGQYIEPGQQEIISTYWNDEQVDGGEYRVRGDLNYITGNSIVDETISISDRIQVEETDEEESDSVPMWLILMTLVVIGVLMYSFEIDPILIASLLGIAGISAFVLMTGLPTYLIGVLIVITVLTLYYGM